MTPRILTRSLPRHRTTHLILALSSGAFILSQQKPLRCDAVTGYHASTPYSSTARRRITEEDESFLNAELVKQLSGGSVSGFVAGLLVSVFSKTLVLLAGMAIAVTQAAQSYGIDLLGMLRIKQTFKSSKVLAALTKNPAFNVAFGTTFALAAFFQF